MQGVEEVGYVEGAFLEGMGLVMGREEGEEEMVRGGGERAYPVEIIKKTVVLVVIVGVFGKVG